AGDTLHIWDTATGKETWRLKRDSSHLQSLAFATDGGSLAVGGQSGVTVFAVPSGEVRRTFAFEPTYCDGVAFAPDGKSVAAACWEAIRVWDLGDGKPLHSFARDPGEHGTGRFASVAFSPDGRTLAAGCRRGAVRLWALPGGKELTPLREHYSDVNR